MALLNLPGGFRPESVTIGAEPFAYFGSLADGSIHRVDLTSGEGRTINRGNGTPAAGLKIDRRGRLFVAGAFAGTARIIDASTGVQLVELRLAEQQPTLVADVVLTPDAAWFTDAFVPVLYRVPVGDGKLPSQAGVERIPLTGDIVYRDGTLNVCGIERTPDGTGLIVSHPETGNLYRVDPATGAGTTVDLRGEKVSGDGMLLVGNTLYLAIGHAYENVVAVVRLSDDGTKGEVLQRITDERFDVPTAVATHDDVLYVVNSRIASVEPTPTTTYNAVTLPRP